MNRKELKAATATVVIVAILCTVAVLPSFAQTSGYWTEKTPLPYGFGPSTSSAVLLNGKIYVVGNSGYSPNPLEVYDPALDSWTQEATMQHYSEYDAVAVCQNKIYDVIANQSYDPTTNTWTAITPSPSGKAFFHPVVLNSKIFAIGGGKGIMEISVANWVYDPVNDSWSQMAPIPTPVETYASVVLGDKIYILGGYYFAGGSFDLPTDLVQIFSPCNQPVEPRNPNALQHVRCSCIFSYRFDGAAKHLSGRRGRLERKRDRNGKLDSDL